MKCTIYWTLIYGIILDSEGTDMLNFIIGTAGSGKSYNLQHKLIDESIKNPDSRFVLLVPDQYSLEAQKEILDKHPNHGAFNIEVSSFNRLAYEVLDEQGFGEAKMMDELTKSILVRKALIDCAKDLKVYGGKINMPGFTEKVKSILDEFGQYGIDDDQLEKIIEFCDKKPILKKKLKDVQIIRESFKEYIDNLHLTSEELLTKFMDVIDASDTIKNAYIYIDGFTGFTPIQEKVISKFAENAKEVTVTATLNTKDVEKALENKTLTTDLFSLGRNTIYNLAKENEVAEIIKIENKNGKPARIKDNEPLSVVSNNIFYQGKKKYKEKQDSIVIREADSLDEEVLSVVKTISSMVRTDKYRYRDFAVITGDMENYYKYIAKTFKKYDIPVFIDYKRSTAENLFADLIIALIRVVEYNFAYESLFHILRSGITPIPEEDIDYIENYVLTFRRTSFKSFSQEWKREIKGIKLTEVNRIRSGIYGLFKDYMSAMTKKGATVGDYCRAIYAFLEKVNISKQIEEYIKRFKENNDYALEDEYSQIHAAIIKLLESLENTLENETISIVDFEKLAISAIEELKIGIIPPGIDDVMVGDIERTRLKDVKKVIFLIGANDGIIPKVASTATIINDSDREELKKFDVTLAPTTKDNVFKQMFYLYTMLVKPTEKFIVSYSKQDKKSDAIRKSYFVEMLENILPSIEIEQISIKEDEPEDIINKNVSYDYIAKSGLARRRDLQTEEERKLYNAISSELSKDEDSKQILDFIRKGTFFKFKDGKISQKTADALYENKDIMITRATKYINCPYKQFVNYGLVLRERDKYDFSNLDVGNIEHHILEDFFKQIVEKGIDVNQADESTLYELLDKCIEKEFEREDLSDYFISDPSNGFAKHQLGEMAKETVDILITQLKNSKFKVSNIEEFRPGGKADRVDTFIEGDKVYVKILDYKTGEKNFTFGDVVTGTDMQVFVYLKDAIEAEQKKPENKGKEVVPAGAFYLRVFNPYIYKNVSDEDSNSETIIKNARVKEYKMTGLANNECGDALNTEGSIKDILVSGDANALDTEYYNKLLDYTDKNMQKAREGIMSGDISVDPYEGACNNCSYKGICRFETKNNDPKTVDKVNKEQVIEILDEEQ